MNCGGAPMSSCRPLKRVKMSTPSYFSAFCMRLVYSGLAAAHSSMAICSISSRPHALMQCAIPERSISCPINSSSGTRVANSSRDSAAYLLIIEGLPRVHLDGGAHVRPLVLGLTLLGGLAALSRNLADGPVEPGAEGEADVLRQEDRHLLQLVLGEFGVEQRRVHLNLAEILATLRRHHRQGEQPLVAHGETGASPDRTEQMVDGQIEVGVSFDVRHLPAVDLVHLLEALLAQLVHPANPSRSKSFVAHRGRQPGPAMRSRPAAGQRRSPRPTRAPTRGPCRPAHGCGRTCRRRSGRAATVSGRRGP